MPPLQVKNLHNLHLHNSEQSKCVFRRDLDGDSDGAHLTSFGIYFQTEEVANENRRSPGVALLCAGGSIERRHGVRFGASVAGV